MTDGKNKLYYGDNLDILRRYIPPESIDLIYLDPPFNSNATYNVLFAEHNGTASAAQIRAFEDTWHWDRAAQEAYQEVVERGPKKAADLLQALRQFLGQNDMMAYLAMMAVRLIELHRVLKPTGSIYLHCDPTASHYIKLVLDAVFSPRNYRNEIVWKRTSSHNDPRRYGRIHDVIFFYSKSDNWTWNTPYEQYDEEYIGREFRRDAEDRLYKCEDLTAPRRNPERAFTWRGRAPGPTREWRYGIEQLEQLWQEGRIKVGKDGKPLLRGQIVYLDEKRGRPAQDLWIDILRVGNTAKERLGFPTQKPEALLERIVLASSNEGDIVLDPFCGCGTAVAVAEHLHRRWIGIDITHLAVNLVKRRLHDTFGDQLSPYEVIGEPVDLKGAQDLAATDPFQFQCWALGLLGARPIEVKKGADKGVDGFIYFHDEPLGKSLGPTKKVIVQVKGGKIGVKEVRELRGVIEREEAAVGVLLTLAQPTKPMLAEAASAGFYQAPMTGKKHPRLQIITITQALDGKGIDMPPPVTRIDVTFRKATRKIKRMQQLNMNLGTNPEGGQ